LATLFDQVNRVHLHSSEWFVEVMSWLLLN